MVELNLEILILAVFDDLNECLEVSHRFTVNARDDDVDDVFVTDVDVGREHLRHDDDFVVFRIGRTRIRVFPNGKKTKSSSS